MKQLIVLVSTIILGVVIGGIVLGFRTSATDIASAAQLGLHGIEATVSRAAIDATTVVK